ncbi:MAG: 50S ribosomal protein L1 [Bacteroidota bacterium]|nr:50S ribosomal protein L1 [Bacteroidota bacterium]
MVKIAKKRKLALEKIDKLEKYQLNEAVRLVKEVSTANFNASVDIDINLGVDPKQANQMVRGVATLPHGTGKEIKVLVLCNPDVVDAAKEAGADYAGLDEYLEKIKGGWTDIDVIITSPDVMPKLGRYGKVLGPRGLMPNPKAGTVTQDIPKAVAEVKRGKIDFRVDKFGIIHVPIGRADFEENQLIGNITELVTIIQKMRPPAAKGTYMKGITISSTMSPGIKVNVKSIGSKTDE